MRVKGIIQLISCLFQPMKNVILLAAFAIASLAATTAHAQTVTPDPNAPTPQQNVQGAQATYDQQRDQRRATEASVKDSKRALREQNSQARDLKHQMKEQRQVAKQQKEQLKQQRSADKAAHEQEKAAKEQLKMQKQAEKDARKS